VYIIKSQREQSKWISGIFRKKEDTEDYFKRIVSNDDQIIM
jgi:hypothetical protein